MTAIVDIKRQKKQAELLRKQKDEVLDDIIKEPVDPKAKKPPVVASETDERS